MGEEPPPLRNKRGGTKELLKKGKKNTWGKKTLIRARFSSPGHRKNVPPKPSLRKKAPKEHSPREKSIPGGWGKKNPKCGTLQNPPN